MISPFDRVRRRFLSGLPSVGGSAPVRLRATLLATLLVGTGCVGEGAEPVTELPGLTFAVIGDTPYTDDDLEAFPRLISELNRSGLPFLIHVGDIKGGGDPCTDEVIAGRAQLYSRFELPFLYTPGDNEWTDCHRSGFDPLDRLDRLRTVFFEEDRFRRPPGHTSQATDPTSPHAEFVENARWSSPGEAGPILLATVHQVGSGNGRESFPGRVAAHDAAADRRDAAARAWIEETFRVAHRDSAVAVVITAHADPRIEVAYSPGPSQPFTPFLRALEAGARSFPGPVLLLQGDTHSCLFDQPAFGRDAEPLPNFYRLRVAGGGGQVGWFAVRILPQEPEGLQVAVRSQMITGGCRLRPLEG